MSSSHGDDHKRVQVWADGCEAAGSSLMGSHESPPPPLSILRSVSAFCLVAWRDSFFHLAAPLPPLPPPSLSPRLRRDERWRFVTVRAVSYFTAVVTQAAVVLTLGGVFYSVLSERRSTADETPPVLSLFEAVVDEQHNNFR